jgi:hypothetical protein
MGRASASPFIGGRPTMPPRWHGTEAMFRWVLPRILRDILRPGARRREWGSAPLPKSVSPPPPGLGPPPALTTQARPPSDVATAAITRRPPGSGPNEPRGLLRLSDPREFATLLLDLVAVGTSISIQTTESHRGACQRWELPDARLRMMAGTASRVPIPMTPIIRPSSRTMAWSSTACRPIIACGGQPQHDVPGCPGPEPTPSRGRCASWRSTPEVQGRPPRGLTLSRRGVRIADRPEGWPVVAHLAMRQGTPPGRG